jgi:hypothetical protein
MFEVLKTKKFATAFSFILGFSIVVFLIPVCTGDQCFIKKAPSPEEMKKTTYRLGKKCYQFRPDVVQCPTKGAIESFTLF